MAPSRLNPALQALKRHVQNKERQAPAVVVVGGGDGDSESDLDSEAVAAAGAPTYGGGDEGETSTFNALEEMRREAEAEQAQAELAAVQARERARLRMQQRQRQRGGGRQLESAIMTTTTTASQGSLSSSTSSSSSAVTRTTTTMSGGSHSYRPRLARIADDGNEDEEEEEEDSPLDDKPASSNGKQQQQQQQQPPSSSSSPPPSLGGPSSTRRRRRRRGGGSLSPSPSPSTTSVSSAAERYGFKGEQLSSAEEESSDGGEGSEDSEESSDEDDDDDDVDDAAHHVVAAAAPTGPHAPSLKDAPTPFSTISNDPFASIVLPPPLVSSSAASPRKRLSSSTGRPDSLSSSSVGGGGAGGAGFGAISYPPSSNDHAYLPSIGYDNSPDRSLAAITSATLDTPSTFATIAAAGGGGGGGAASGYYRSSTTSTMPLILPDSPTVDRKTRSGRAAAADGTTATIVSASGGLSSLSLSLSRRRTTDGGGAGSGQQQRSNKPLTQEDIDGDRLRALGYDQVLGRDYDLWSAFSLCYLNIGVLQGALFGVLATWTYGGPRAILTVWPIGGLILTLITITLAELTSSYPICGAFPAWVWRICRNGIGHERELSWMVAGLVLLYHIGVSTLVPWQLAGFIAETIQLARPDVVLERWWVLLFALGIIGILAVLGSFRIGRHPWLWKSAFVYSIAVWIVLVVSLLAKSRPSSAILHQPFTNATGYTSKALVYMLCLVGTSVATGVDAASHFAEEVRNPARNLPIAMIGSTLLSYTLGYIGFWVFLMVVDSQTLEAISVSRFPSGAILTQTLGDRGGVTLLVLILVAVGFQALVQIQASARYVFSISRDQALPLASLWARTSRSQLPVNALWLISAVVAILQVAVWASPDALPGIVSGSAATGCLLVYMLPVALYVVSDLDLQNESRTAFTLRRASKPIGLVASILITYLLVLVQIPSSIPVSASNFSWSIVVTVGVLLLSGASWMLYGRHRYSGPIKAITAWTAGQPISLQDAVKRESSSDGMGDRDVNVVNAS